MSEFLCNQMRLHVKIVETENQILGMIKRTFTFKIKDNLLFPAIQMFG